MLVVAAILVFGAFLMRYRPSRYDQMRRLALLPALVGVLLLVASLRSVPSPAEALPPVAVPDVVGRDVVTAVALLHDAGLAPRVATSCSDDDAETVLRVSSVSRNAWWGVEQDLVTKDGVQVEPGSVARDSEVVVWTSTGESCAGSLTR